MGRAKQEQQEFEEKVQYAIGLCLEIGALQECAVHTSEYVDPLSYLDYAELTTDILKQEPNALQNFDSRQEMTDCIAEAMNSVGEECGLCASYRDS